MCRDVTPHSLLGVSCSGTALVEKWRRFLCSAFRFTTPYACMISGKAEINPRSRRLIKWNIHHYASELQVNTRSLWSPLVSRLTAHKGLSDSATFINPPTYYTHTHTHSTYWSSHRCASRFSAMKLFNWLHRFKVTSRSWVSIVGLAQHLRS